MTDEMTIQQRKSPLIPTVLSAAAGTGIGYGVGHLMTKPMTHDDVIAEVNAKDKFEVRVKEGAPEAATWQEVKNKADEVAKLKGALEEAKLGELVDTDLTSKIEKAKQAIESELEKYTKETTGTVASMTREEAIEKSGDTYKELQKNLNDLLEKAKTADRKIDDAAVKTAQEKFDAGEKSLKEMTESLGKKMTKGPNKWVAAGIGAAALGLATLLAVNSKNNKAQA